MDDLDGGSGPLQRAQLFFARPVAGPLMFGLIFGGVPFGIAFVSLGGDVVSPNLLARTLELTPLAIILASVGAMYGADPSIGKVFKRTLITSVGECIPFPTMACGAAAWYAGFAVLSPENLPVLIYLLFLWAAVVTLAGFCVASLFYLLKARRPRTDRSNATLSVKIGSDSKRIDPS